MANIEDKIKDCLSTEASKEVKTEQLVEIAKELAKKFALWKEYNTCQDHQGNYYSESRIGVSRKNPVNIDSLMTLFLEQERLFNKYTNNEK